MNKINNLAELKEERRRLQYKRAEFEVLLKAEYQHLKEELKPSKLILDAVSRAAAHKHKDIIGNTTKSVVDLLINKVVLRNAGFITKIVGGIVAHKLTDKVVTDNKSSIASWVINLLDKVTTRPETDIQQQRYATSDINPLGI